MFLLIFNLIINCNASLRKNLSERLLKEFNVKKEEESTLVVETNIKY